MESMDAAEAALRKWYAEDRGRRVARGMREKAERGIMPGCAPLGYINAVIGGERVIVPDPEKAPKVRRLFELAIRKRMTLARLSKEAERMDLKSRNGSPLGGHAIRVILANPFYLGYLKHHERLILGQHPGIVSKSVFLANRFSSNVSTTGNGRKFGHTWSVSMSIPANAVKME